MAHLHLVDRSKTCLSSVLGHATTLEIKHGRGCYLIDYADQAYLDFGAGIAVNSTGHCHPEVVAAIHTQSQTLLHGCAGVIYYDQNILLAEELGRITNGELSSVFFTQSGTEAIEAALKCAMYVRNAQQIVSFNGGFHGRTLGSLSVTTSNPNYVDRYPMAIPHRIVLEYPYFFRNNPPLHTESGYSDYLKNALSAVDANQTAAVIIEPFLGEGGYVPAPASVLQILRDWCNATGVFLIFDEIQSGIGRTGQWFYYQHYAITPDILTTAKGIASGLPLGACLSTPSIMAAWKTGSHGGTYGGNPLTCAAACATLRILQDQLPTVTTLGEHAYARLQAAFANHPYVGDIRAKGLMIGIEWVTETGAPNAEIVKRIRDRCLQNQLLILSCGRHGHVIRLMPPLIITKDELDEGLTRFIDACHHVLS
jgi:4-aminobutyrate aminotransferase